MVNTVNTGGLETLAATGRNANRSDRADGRSFDSFLEPQQRENAQRRPDRPVRSDGQREQHRPNSRIETVMATHEQAAQPVAEGEAPVALVEEQPQEISDAVAELPENCVVALVLLEDEVLAEIAAVLGITTQALAEILNALGMTPMDLLEGQAQTELLQLLHGLDDEVALLNLPAILPIMQEITKTMEKHAPALLEYQAEIQQLPQYAVLEEVALADLEADPYTTELMPQAPRPARSDAPQAELPADYDVAEAVTTAATTTTESTAPTAPEPQQSIEPIMAFAQATEQPIDSFARPTPVEAPLPQAPVNPQNVMEQIVSHMRFEVRGDMAEIRIQLRPEHLGEVSLRVAMQNGIVVAQFVAESQRVKEIIESNFNQLRDALEQQGINVAEIEVSVSQGEADRNFDFEANISGDRIRDIMEAEEAESDEEVKLEENLVDYLA